MIKLTKTPILPNCQVPNGFFFGITVNFIIQKLKRKHLVVSVFSGDRFFWGNERKYFTHIPGPNWSAKIWVGAIASLPTSSYGPKMYCICMFTLNNLFSRDRPFLCHMYIVHTYSKYSVPVFSSLFILNLMAKKYICTQHKREIFLCTIHYILHNFISTYLLLNSKTLQAMTDFLAHIVRNVDHKILNIEKVSDIYFLCSTEQARFTNA